MNARELRSLKSGNAYLVKIRGQSMQVRRIFKWTETRFGSIPCAVFTAKVHSDVRGQWDPARKTLRLTGSRLPAQELSVPHYDILECAPA